MNCRKVVRLTAILACTLCVAALTRADVLIYVSGGWIAGGGTWTGSSPTWVNGYDATFSGSGTVVTLTGAISAGTVSFSSTGYTIFGNSSQSLAATTVVSDAAAATINVPFTLSNTTFNVVDASDGLLVSGLVSGSGLTKTGAGTLTLLTTSAASYTGTTSVLAGTLKIGRDAPNGGPGALGSSTTSVLLGDTSGSASASLIINGAFTVGRSITIQSGNSGIITVGGNSSSSSATFSGSIALNKDASISQVAGGTLNVTGGISAGEAGTKTLTLANAGSVTVSTTAIADGSGTVAVSQTGAGTTTLSATNTYTGGTTISAGAINVTGSLSSSGGLTVNGGTLTFSSSAQVSSLSGSGGTISFASPSGKTLTIAQASNTSYSGAITASGANLAKSGAGTLTLSGGASSIALGAGSLSVTGGGAVNLSPSANAPFSGTSTTVSLDSGTLILGNSFSQTFGGLALGNAGSNTINFNSTTTSTLTFGATPTGSGTVSISNYNYASDPVNDSGPTLRITGSPAGALSFFTINGSPAAYYGASDILVAIPEPSTYAAAAGVIALGAAVCRRRRRVAPAVVATRR